MPLDVTGRHFYRRDTTVRGERGLRAEPVDRAGTGQNLRSDHVADAVQIGQGGPGRRDRRGQRCCCFADAPIEAANLAEQVHGDLAQGTGQHGPWPDAARRSGCGVSSQPAGQAGRDELGEQRMQPVDGLCTGTDQVVAMFGEDAQGRDRFIDDRGVEPGGGMRGDADGQGVGLVGFAAVPGRQQPNAAGHAFLRHSASRRRRWPAR